MWRNISLMQYFILQWSVEISLPPWPTCCWRCRLTLRVWSPLSSILGSPTKYRYVQTTQPLIKKSVCTVLLIVFFSICVFLKVQHLKLVLLGPFSGSLGRNRKEGGASIAVNCWEPGSRDKGYLLLYVTIVPAYREVKKFGQSPRFNRQFLPLIHTMTG